MTPDQIERAIRQLFKKRCCLNLSVESGTYTSTAVAGSNIASIIEYSCQYLRVGQVVNFSGQHNNNLFQYNLFNHLSTVKHGSNTNKNTKL